MGALRRRPLVSRSSTNRNCGTHAQRARAREVTFERPCRCETQGPRRHGLVADANGIERASSRWMANRKVDALLLGAGNAGQAAAEELRGAGKSVVIAEGRDVGGTCPLRGCIPKKVLVAAAEALDTMKRAQQLGITVAASRLDWDVLLQRKRSVVEGT